MTVHSIRSGRVHNGGKQAGPALGAFELPGQNAFAPSERDGVIIEPAPPRSLLARLAELPDLDEDFGPIGDPAPAPIQL